jgi:hypothetical protein
VLERTIPTEIDEALFARLAARIESASGSGREAGSTPRSYTWRSDRSAGGQTTVVRVTVGDGETTIRIEERYGNLAGGLFGGVLGGVGGGLGIGAGTALAFALQSELFLFAFPALVIGTTFASVRFGFKRYVQKRHRVLQQVLEDIEAVLRTSLVPAAEKQTIAGADSVTPRSQNAASD